MDQDKNISMEVDGHNELSLLMELSFYGADEVEYVTMGPTNKVRVSNSSPSHGKKQVNQSGMRYFFKES